MEAKEHNGDGRPMSFPTMETEWDNGAGQRNVIHERSHAQLSELKGDAKGVLFLLLSARASLPRHGADDECLRTMEECIASFRARYDLTDENTNAGILSNETRLLWLLEYAHGEVSERLQDWRCAEQLETCIDHFKAECVF
jgi:hypothetical protein